MLDAFLDFVTFAVVRGPNVDLILGKEQSIHNNSGIREKSLIFMKTILNRESQI